MSQTERLDIMIDLETLGLAANAPIVSIGAVVFDINTGEVGEGFYTKVEWIHDQHDRPINRETVAWWLQQDRPAQTELIDRNGVRKLNLALKRLDDYFEKYKGAYVWANGAAFDPVILDHAYQNQANRMPPWGFRNIRDCRTIKDLGEQLGMDFYREFHNAGQAHNALDDCVFQAQWTSAAWQKITQTQEVEKNVGLG